MPYGWDETKLASWPVSGQCQLAGAMPAGGGGGGEGGGGGGVWQLSVIVSCTERRWQPAELSGLQRWQPAASPRKKDETKIFCCQARRDAQLRATAASTSSLLTLQCCLKMACVFPDVVWGSPLLTEQNEPIKVRYDTFTYFWWQSKANLS